MGYYCNKEIASVVEPSEMTLANNPNFVVFSSRKDTANDPKSVGSIKILQVYPWGEAEWAVQANFAFKLIEKKTGTKYPFLGTYNKNKVSDNVFFVPSRSHLEGGRLLSQSEANKLTIQNIKECLLKNTFIKNNFEISIRTTLDKDGIISFDNSLDIVSKGSGLQYDFELIENGMSIGVSYSTRLAYFQYCLETISVPDSEDIVKETLGLNVKVFESADNKPERIVYERLWNGTLDPLKANDDTYLLTPMSLLSTEDDSRRTNMASIVAVIKKDKTLLSYLDIVFDDYNCFIKSRNQPNYYRIEIIGDESRFSITERDITSVFADTIDYGTGSYQIELDIYTDHEVFPGNADTGLNPGKYVTTLSKSYFGRALWFDLSILLGKKVSYSPAFLTELELDQHDKDFKLWSNAGTMTDYRFIAKRTDGVIHEPFYYSSPLYVLNGYNYTLDSLNLEKDETGESYILDFSQMFYADKFTKVKPLTTNFTRTHIKGQRQYFNYIHKYIASTLPNAGADNLLPSIGLHYKLYTQSGVLIGTHTEQGQEAQLFNKVNTALLQLDQFLPMYNHKIVGRIDVYLCRWHKSRYLGIDEPEVIISTPLSFRILPEVLNDVNDFAFLNQLGGWDTMNFGGSASSEFKSTSSTIYKTLQPDFNLQSEIESVALKSVQEQKTAQTSPVTTETIQWLRQMSASPAVYELSTKRYILIDDMSLKYNSTDDLSQIEMKYHYTDSFK